MRIREQRRVRDRESDGSQTQDGFSVGNYDILVSHFLVEKEKAGREIEREM